MLRPHCGRGGAVQCPLILKLNLSIGEWAGRVESSNLAKAAGRLGILQEAIDGIKAVKFFAWEQQYIPKLVAAREEECVSIRKHRMLLVTTVTLGRASPVLASVCTILVYSLVTDDISSSPGAIFATISIFQSLRYAT